MLRRIALLACLIVLAFSFGWPVASVPSSYAADAVSMKQAAQPALADFPTVDPDYIYGQLYTMATTYVHREAGYDNGLPPQVNGHDEFADYWVREISRDLQGFHPTVRQDAFAVRGWRGRPANTPATNVEVSVPGLTHPEQVVVIGCHYDGEADSTQSANDDASGCAIELGVARALGSYWMRQHVYPARTLRFVLFDAEEQGLYGSFHYVNETVNGDLGNVVAMFNEEQSGIGYPVQYLGEANNPPLPMDIFLSPLAPNELYPEVNALTPAQRAAIVGFRDRMNAAIPAVFRQFQALGYSALVLRDTNGTPSVTPVFGQDQTRYVRSQDDTVGSSDQLPFNLAGLPSAMLVGNGTYYDSPGPGKPAWSYPYDQPQDTIQLMNTFASGSSRKAESLALALALPGMLTTWMLHQPEVLGEAAPDGLPLASIGDVGSARPGKALALDASGSFDPSGVPLTYRWDFGDGGTGTGMSVSHAYLTAGTYVLSLTVASASGSRTVKKTVAVTANPPQMANPYTQFQSDGLPQHMSDVVLPTPDNSLTTSQFPVPAALEHAPVPVGTSYWPILAAGVLALLLAVGGGFVLWRRARVASVGLTLAGGRTEEELARERRAAALQALAEGEQQPGGDAGRDEKRDEEGE